MSNNSVIQICLMRTAFVFVVARCGLCFLLMLGLSASSLGQSIKAVREDHRRRDNLHLIDSIEQESIFEGWEADRGWIFRMAEERKVVRDDSIMAFGGGHELSVSFVASDRWKFHFGISETVFSRRGCV